jgi:hypothetical protein
MAFIEYSDELIENNDLTKEQVSNFLLLSIDDYALLKKTPQKYELNKEQVVALFHYTDIMKNTLLYPKESREEIFSNYNYLAGLVEKGQELNETEQYIFNKNKEVIKKLRFTTPLPIRKYGKQKINNS